jgi:hypothetical protein
MPKSAVVFATLFTLIAAAAPCRAWNSTGHEIVAQIAFDTMPADARAKIVAILKTHPRLKEDLLDDAADLAKGEDPDRAMFLRAATWPDMVRYIENPLSHTENHPKWHYVDYPFELDGVHGEQPVEKWDGQSDPANLLQAMQKVTAELKDPQTPAARKAIDLCWVEHLAGDVHQPLHAVSMFSKEYPTGDQGGNLVIVRNPGDIILNVPTINLHAMWDDMEGLSMDAAVIRQIADRIEKEHPASEVIKDNSNLDVASWAKESFQLAKTSVYLNGTLPHTTRNQTQQDVPPALPADYEKNSVGVADQRIAQAGYRLAAELQDIAKSL